jgi:hypothetical protein
MAIEMPRPNPAITSARVLSCRQAWINTVLEDGKRGIPRAMRGKRRTKETIMRTACAMRFFLTESESMVEAACAELEFDIIDPLRNGLSELPPVACFILTVATPERSWIVMLAERLSESRREPCFTAHIHGLDVLVTSS